MTIARTKFATPFLIQRDILAIYKGRMGTDPLPVQWLLDSIVLGAQQPYTAYDGDGDYGGTARVTTPETRASNTILAAGDVGKILSCTASFTQTLTAAATLATGWWCVLRNDTPVGSGVVITIDPNGAETIDGAATITVAATAARVIVCNGTLFVSGDWLV